jgi:hypothetical protein
MERVICLHCGGVLYEGRIEEAPLNLTEAHTASHGGPTQARYRIETGTLEAEMGDAATSELLAAARGPETVTTPPAVAIEREDALPLEANVIQEPAEDAPEDATDAPPVADAVEA